MKNSGKKIVTAQRAGKKRKRKKKLRLKDGVRAAVIAAFLIGVTALVAVSLMTANSVVRSSSHESVPVAEEAPFVTDDISERENPAREIITEADPPKETVIPPAVVQPTANVINTTERVVAPALVNTTEAAEKPAAVIITTETVEKPKPVPVHKGSIVLVMDDAGNNLHELDAFLAFSGPLTIAVLPGLPYSAEAARRIRNSGKEVILHQPMEAIGGQNPGPGAIYSSMSDAEIRALVEKNLAEVGPVAGMNNHQGSKITMDERVMEIILSICHDKGIYFLDSRTTADTAAPLVAGRRGTKIWERDVFLDNIQEKAAMIRSFHEGLAKAEKKGGAIMIGHVWSSELAATLEELYPEMVEQGFSLSTISKVMMGTFDNDDSWD